MRWILSGLINRFRSGIVTELEIQSNSEPAAMQILLLATIIMP